MVSGFCGGQLELEDPAAPLQGGKRMIPKLENTFQVGVGPKKFNPSRCAADLHGFASRRSAFRSSGPHSIQYTHKEKSMTVCAGFGRPRKILEPAGTALSWLRQRSQQKRYLDGLSGAVLGSQGQ